MTNHTLNVYTKYLFGISGPRDHVREHSGGRGSIPEANFGRGKRPGKFIGVK